MLLNAVKITLGVAMATFCSCLHLISKGLSLSDMSAFIVGFLNFSWYPVQYCSETNLGNDRLIRGPIFRIGWCSYVYMTYRAILRQCGSEEEGPRWEATEAFHWREFVLSTFPSFLLSFSCDMKRFISSHVPHSDVLLNCGPLNHRAQYLELRLAVSQR